MMTDLASTTPQSLGRDPMVGLRLARVDGFEPAIALGQDELPAYLRRFTILFADDATMRRGGIGRVTRAVNAQGEAVALKQLILPTRDEFDDDAAHEALVAKFKAAFREEYECHRALSGLKGFPRLYGWGEVDGVPAIVMEWVEGETLARLRSRLAVDDAGRLSPLVAGMPASFMVMASTSEAISPSMTAQRRPALSRRRSLVPRIVVVLPEPGLDSTLIT